MSASLLVSAGTPAAAAAAAQGNGLSEGVQALLPGVPVWVATLIGAGVGFALIMAFVTVLVMFSAWLERKAAGHIQTRLGPMRVGGWHGWAQSIADGVKLLLKEDIIVRESDSFLFKLAPPLVLGSALATFVALPFFPGGIIADVDLGVFFIISVSALATVGVIMAGWGSNNKWSVYGAMREAAQVASYEIPLGLALMPPVLYYGTFSLKAASQAQSHWGGLGWYVFSDAFWIAIPSFLLFFTAALAETKRAPFDLPEAESELVAGFHTEYSGIRFSFFYMEEYAAMFVMSALGTAFWFGGYNFPGLGLLEGTPWLYALAAVTVFTAKAMFLVFVMIWVRWTIPRIRIDQVMTMGYKYLIPLSLILVFLAATWEYLKFTLGMGA